jgi:septum formation protein
MGGQPPLRLILASASPGRRDLLTRAGYSFEVAPANIEEPDGSGFTDPRMFVQHVAWLKAAAVAPRVSADLGPAVVLAADTVAWLNGQPIGKPADEADARHILRLLAGAEHQLWTGVCLWHRPTDLQVAWQEVSRVVMHAMNEDELTAYLGSRLWQGCSGAYAIQEEQDPYVRVVEGSMSNVIGLPMETTEEALRWIASLTLHDSAAHQLRSGPAT